jgi:hypothetical protein
VSPLKFFILLETIGHKAFDEYREALRVFKVGNRMLWSLWADQ